MAYHIINPDTGHTRSKLQLNKNLKRTFASPSKSTDEKEKKKKKKKKKAIAKRFALHTNAIKLFAVFFWFKFKILASAVCNKMLFDELPE